MSVQSIYSSLGMLGFHAGFVDLLAIVRNEPSEPLYAIDIVDEVIPRTILAASSFRLNVDQAPKVTEKSAGESVDPSNFMVPPLTISATLDMPLQSPIHGWVDPAFADLYHMTRLSYAGTPTVALTRCRQTMAPSATELLVDNAADFVRLTTPFTVSIIDNGITSSATVTNVNKRLGKFTFSGAIGRATTSETQIFAPLRAASDIFHERAFSLVSLREGLLTGCLVKSIELSFKPGQPIKVSSEIQACRLDRYHQMAIRNESAAIVAAYAAQPPARMVGHTAVVIESIASDSWSFGMDGVIDSPLFRGFSGIDLLSTSIQEFTFKIEHNIVPIHSMHAVGIEPERAEYDNAATREMLNAFPFALAAESRIVNGTITYKAPIEPWALAERLSGPNGIGQNGLRISADTFVLDVPHVIWAPSSGTGQSKEAQTRQVQWTMVTDVYEDLPAMTYITS
jgi:hypothetical protein